MVNVWLMYGFNTFLIYLFGGSSGQHDGDGPTKTERGWHDILAILGQAEHRIGVMFAIPCLPSGDVKIAIENGHF